MFKTEEPEKVEELSRSIRTTLGESLLHLAVVQYAETGDERYMKLLMEINFPLYVEDEQGDIGAFALALCDSDMAFTKGLQILVDGGFDVNYETLSSKTMLTFMAPLQITLNRVKFLNQKGLRV